MFTENDNNLFRQAKEQWGTHAQILMACEEAAELTRELLHYIRGRNDIKHVVDEIADMTIMCAQLRLIFGEKEVDAQIRKKIERLNLRLIEAYDKDS